MPAKINTTCPRCGNQFVTLARDWLRGHTKSCGCLKREVLGLSSLTHGRSHTRLYRVWSNMNQRCENPNDTKFLDYGGRGISVCSKWRGAGGFITFLAEMGEGKSGWQIERVDNDGNYELFNCVWATPKRQARNRRSNRILTIGGKTGCLVDLAAFFGIPRQTVAYRLNRGWSVERAFGVTAPSPVS